MILLSLTAKGTALMKYLDVCGGETKSAIVQALQKDRQKYTQQKKDVLKKHSGWCLVNYHTVKQFFSPLLSFGLFLLLDLVRIWNKVEYTLKYRIHMYIIWIGTGQIVSVSGNKNDTNIPVVDFIAGYQLSVQMNVFNKSMLMWILYIQW